MPERESVKGHVTGIIPPLLPVPPWTEMTLLLVLFTTVAAMLATQVLWISPCFSHFSSRAAAIFWSS
jgi:hypothetical protein